MWKPHAKLCSAFFSPCFVSLPLSFHRSLCIFFRFMKCIFRIKHYPNEISFQIIESTNVLSAPTNKYTLFLLLLCLLSIHYHRMRATKKKVHTEKSKHEALYIPNHLPIKFHRQKIKKMRVLLWNICICEWLLFSAPWKKNIFSGWVLPCIQRQQTNREE